MKIKLSDSHCHLHFPELVKNLPEIVRYMQENQVYYALSVCVDLVSFADLLRISEQYPFIFASVGVHPDQKSQDLSDTQSLYEQLVALAQHKKVVALGETGLDYFRSPSESEVAMQQQRFRAHIRAAIKVNKPLIIHMRSATEDTLAIMQEEGAERCGGVMHCFVENQQVAQRAIALNFSISISGIVTFKNAQIVQEVARTIPLDRLLIETDAPYLAPVPYRGKINQPAYVKYVAQAIAHLRGESLETIAKVTVDNFLKLFSIMPI